MRDGRRDNTLLGVLDQTCTPMGARLIADWLIEPSDGPRADYPAAGCHRGTLVNQLTLRDDAA
jgi:hypothetical protein